jgi:hypothetical protein
MKMMVVHLIEMPEVEVLAELLVLDSWKGQSWKEVEVIDLYMYMH